MHVDTKNGHLMDQNATHIHAPSSLTPTNHQSSSRGSGLHQQHSIHHSQSSATLSYAQQQRHNQQASQWSMNNHVKQQQQNNERVVRYGRRAATDNTPSTRPESGKRIVMPGLKASQAEGGYSSARSHGAAQPVHSSSTQAEIAKTQASMLAISSKLNAQQSALRQRDFALRRTQYHTDNNAEHPPPPQHPQQQRQSFARTSPGVIGGGHASHRMTSRIGSRGHRNASQWGF